MPLHLLFTRHGETDDNLTRTLQGHRDTSLTSNGHADAAALAQKLRTLHPKGIDAIYHSPLLRIRQTIAPYLDLCSPPTNGTPNDSPTDSPLPRPTLHPDDDLKGQFLGPLEGQSYDVIDMTSPRSADPVDGVEVFDDFVARLLRVFGRIVAAESRALLEGKRSSEGGGEMDRVVMIATHGVGITSLFKALEASPACEGFLGPEGVARRGEGAWEVRWTDADDVARVVVGEEGLRGLVLGMDGEGRKTVDWEKEKERLRRGGEKVFVIEDWGKREKAL